MLISLRSRLITFYLAVLFIGFGGLTLWSSNQIINSTIADYGNLLQIQALSLGSRLAETLEYNPQGADTVIQQVADNLGGEVTLFNSAKAVQSTTATDPFGLVSTTGFVIDSDANNVRQIIASAEVRDGDDLEGYIQINVPRSVPAANVRQRLITLWSVFAAFTLLGISATLWLITSMTQPLGDLQQTALNMAAGDLSQRVENPSQDEIGAVGQAFNTMATQVESIVADQRAFASNASHELRTPLTTIRLRTEMMIDGGLDEQTKEEFVEEIDSEVKRMSGLVDDLLLLSRIDAKRLSAGTEQVDAARLLKKIFGEFEPQAAEKQIDLELSTIDTLLVTANLNHVESVYRNIISNGIKYTPTHGRVSVNLKQDGGQMIVTVADNGEGISSEDMPNIGKRFFRVDQAHSRAVAGTGLGLALVMSIMQLYNGEMEISSQGLGDGTTVDIRWPISQ